MRQSGRARGSGLSRLCRDRSRKPRGVPRGMRRRDPGDRRRADRPRDGRDRPAARAPRRRARAHRRPAAAVRQRCAQGDWLDAPIDPALPERQPLPRPDLRRVNVALGPVAVFGASNFPLAFSVAGGDTASALAAGCPVIVKGHSAHPGNGRTGRARAIAAREKSGMPEGVFSYLRATAASSAPRWSAIRESRRSASPARAAAASR